MRLGRHSSRWVSPPRFSFAPTRAPRPRRRCRRCTCWAWPASRVATLAGEQFGWPLWIVSAFTMGVMIVAAVADFSRTPRAAVKSHVAEHQREMLQRDAHCCMRRRCYIASSTPSGTRLRRVRTIRFIRQNRKKAPLRRRRLPKPLIRPTHALPPLRHAGSRRIAAHVCGPWNHGSSSWPRRRAPPRQRRLAQEGEHAQNDSLPCDRDAGAGAGRSRRGRRRGRSRRRPADRPRHQRQRPAPGLPRRRQVSRTASPGSWARSPARAKGDRRAARSPDRRRRPRDQQAGSRRRDDRRATAFSTAGGVEPDEYQAAAASTPSAMPMPARAALRSNMPVPYARTMQGQVQPANYGQLRPGMGGRHGRPGMGGPRHGRPAGSMAAGMGQAVSYDNPRCPATPGRATPRTPTTPR